MKKWNIRSLFLSFLFSLALASTHPVVLIGATQEPQPVERAKQLKAFIQKEKPNFEVRENQRRDVLLDLDKLNAEQNKVRERIASMSASQIEMAMAVENLSVEYLKQKELEQQQRRRLYLLLKLAYKIRKDGMLRFVFNGQDLTQLAARVRILYRTLRSHSLITQQLAQRAERLVESEKRLSRVREEQTVLLQELGTQEALLGELLTKKNRVLKGLNRKQNSYQFALKEYKRLSTQLATIFSSIKPADEELANEAPIKGSLNLPVSGRVVQGFGKSVHEKFGTVIYHKGIEIEAEHSAPVNAVLPGVVEYTGWVRGLGNVVILHHGKGFYTLNAHLFKMGKPVGAHVESGEAIGSVGDTGNNERPSLYFEIREKGKAVDPVAYFSPTALNQLN